jgi:hypothetical protein
LLLLLLLLLLVLDIHTRQLLLCWRLQLLCPTKLQHSHRHGGVGRCSRGRPAI